MEPSFSLGLDFDLDTETSPLVAPDSPSQESLPVLGNDQDDRQLQYPAQGPSAPTEPAPIFRRLRRGPSATKVGLSLNRYSEQLPHSMDDDIEEFSSQEFPSRDEMQTAQHRSMSSCSKFCLDGGNARISHFQPVGITTRKQLSDAPRSYVAKDKVHSKSSMSPLRMFQLLESDSDDSFELIHANKDASNKQSTTPEIEPRRHKRAFVSPLKNLWDGFRPKETNAVPTPALDNFCEEYFKRVKDKQATSSSAPRGSCITRGESSNYGSTTNCQLIDLENGAPPSHLYFFHCDPRIKRLVRSRLSHFQPLCIVNNTENQHVDDVSAIDYVGQFGDNKQKSGANSVKKTSGSRKNQKVTSSISGGWVNPRNLAPAVLPKDAGKRRVHAESQSPGQWYTAENGRKVYINKNGQEFTGQTAYRQYKKESGGGFRKSKGKTSSKRRKK